MKFRDKVISFFLLITAPLCHCTDRLQETLLGAVGGGNYSYYWLPQPGTVVLYLNTIQGDADLYVSSKNLKPTFEIEHHELQSTTCGSDHIKVPSNYGRPISIAVYGHPSHEVSLYELKIDISEAIADAYEDMVEEEIKAARNEKTQSAENKNSKDDAEYEERPVFWTLLLHILQVLLDLLVD